MEDVNEKLDADTKKKIRFALKAPGADNKTSKPARALISLTKKKKMSNEEAIKSSRLDRAIRKYVPGAGKKEAKKRKLDYTDNVNYLSTSRPGYPHHDDNMKELGRSRRAAAKYKKMSNEEFNRRFLELVSMMDEERKPLTIQQRRKRALTLRKYKNVLSRRKKQLEKRPADSAHISARAKRMAWLAARRRYAGQKGLDYAKLSPSQKIAIDNIVYKKVKPETIKRIAKRVEQAVRRKDLEHVKAKRSGQKEKKVAMPALTMSYEPLDNMLGETWKKHIGDKAAQVAYSNGLDLDSHYDGQSSSKNYAFHIHKSGNVAYGRDNVSAFSAHYKDDEWSEKQHKTLAAAKKHAHSLLKKKIKEDTDLSELSVKTLKSYINKAHPHAKALHYSSRQYSDRAEKLRNDPDVRRGYDSGIAKNDRAIRLTKLARAQKKKSTNRDNGIYKALDKIVDKT